jgi:hypothetical protein
MTQHQPTYGFHYREAIVEAYSSMIAEKMDEGREGYFVNLMFNQLLGSRQNRMDTMRQEVERVHWILAKHMIHRPNHRNWAHLRPIFVGSPDLRVFKWDRGEPDRLVVANDGLHFNTIALVPPPSLSILPSGIQNRLWGLQSRLKVSLDQHFRDRSEFYLNDRLARIHVTPVSHGTMADYTLKAFKHGRLDEDSILVLN